ncbi:hypothetical protein DFH11DRAFT_1505761 [Phellopilus nigrolimitatus]|nr:hypothetical protein DFH11DRAFT_1525117 [Phellopilus nigrolimitatus]KAH8101360.1 hypothetical protein DFH11DRAFT_1524142 [Phellopilus nigrolimitatus]KAH8104437.1 hypothetical protein DFH11DRAFT_1519479 [Phellopilus nigrolimitatus]KAH8116787.1 hypothetical protein DFH11DRAFT_1505761 [Phellopilus nigrolimitatus]
MTASSPTLPTDEHSSLPASPNRQLSIPPPPARPAFDPSSIKDPRERKASEWIEEAEAYLRKHMVGDLADALVRLWIEFEGRLGYPGNSERIPKPGRPAEVDWWQKRGRDYSKFPPVQPPDEYFKTWFAWYQGLQPAGCRCDSAWPLPRDDSDAQTDWTILKKGGPNGIFIVLLTLAFWADGLQTSAEIDIYESAMADVTWVLKTMLDLLGGGKRKMAGDGDSADVGKRSKRRTK